MDKEEILRYLNCGDTHSICIERSLLPEYPGYVRDMTIQKGAILTIEFNTYGYDEGGLIVNIAYDNLEQLIVAVEKYLHRPLAEWSNINKSGWYPERNDEADTSMSGNALKQDVIHENLHLPEDGKKYTIPSGYWKDLKEGKIRI